MPNRFKKIKVNARDKGILTLHIGESEEDFQKAMCLELHPKHDGGEFFNPSLQKLFKRVDETAYANDQRSLRSSRLKALNAVSDMIKYATDQIGLGNIINKQNWDLLDVLGKQTDQLDLFRGIMYDITKNPTDQIIANTLDIKTNKGIISTFANNTKTGGLNADEKIVQNYAKRALKAVEENNG